MNKDHIQPEFVLVITGRAFISDDVSSALTHTVSKYCGVMPVSERLGDVALEYGLDRNYNGLVTALEEHYGSAKLDFNVVPGLERKKKLLLADMDATLIVNECIDELAEATKNENLVKTITARTMEGGVEFCQSLTDA